MTNPMSMIRNFINAKKIILVFEFKLILLKRSKLTILSLKNH